MRFNRSDGVLLLMLSLFLLLTPGESSEVCKSPGGRFPPYKNEGKPPITITKGPKDLNICRVFRTKTCCDVDQTHPALLSIRRLASSGEASQDCLNLWELLECSICDPWVGVQSGLPVICPTLCDKVYEACANAYFSMDVKTQVLAPCGVNDFVCGRASKWISNGTDLCRAAGFAVKTSDHIEETSCYGGKASLDTIAKSWKGSQSAVPKKPTKLGSWNDFQKWAKKTPFGEKVCWAVGGMVLTAGLFFLS
ncbi:uncharacterized protein LOC124913981 isoform X2 [Impatiens glandulifera]|nr:uncharacterized protein LOC124913981 isoform X2 [Impatiens glandulifera]